MRTRRPLPMRCVARQATVPTATLSPEACKRVTRGDKLVAVRCVQPVARAPSARHFVTWRRWSAKGPATLAGRAGPGRFSQLATDRPDEQESTRIRSASVPDTRTNPITTTIPLGDASECPRLSLKVITRHPQSARM